MSTDKSGHQNVNRVIYFSKTFNDNSQLAHIDRVHYRLELAPHRDKVIDLTIVEWQEMNAIQKLIGGRKIQNMCELLVKQCVLQHHDDDDDGAPAASSSMLEYHNHQSPASASALNGNGDGGDDDSSKSVHFDLRRNQTRH